MWRDRREWDIEAKSEAAGSGHALPGHNALLASIPPLRYASPCLDSTPTRKHAASHTELVLTFCPGLSIICSHQDNRPPMIPWFIVKDAERIFFCILRLWKENSMPWHLTNMINRSVLCLQTYLINIVIKVLLILSFPSLYVKIMDRKTS